jgi:hypothetical protein
MTSSLVQNMIPNIIAYKLSTFKFKTQTLILTHHGPPLNLVCLEYHKDETLYYGLKINLSNTQYILNFICIKLGSNHKSKLTRKIKIYLKNLT